CSSVLLPDPDRPTTESHSPGATCRSTPPSTLSVRLPSRNVRERARASRMADFESRMANGDAAGASRPSSFAIRPSPYAMASLIPQRLHRVEGRRHEGRDDRADHARGDRADHDEPRLHWVDAVWDAVEEVGARIPHDEADVVVER